MPDSNVTPAFCEAFCAYAFRLPIYRLRSQFVAGSRVLPLEIIMYIQSLNSSMETFGKVNNRDIIYQKHALDVNWTKAMPTNNWLLVVVVEEQNRRILDEMSRKAIVNNVCYICCIGKQAELLHDMIDEEIMFREVDIDNHYLPPFNIITTFDKSLKEGIWFALHAAQHETVEINTVFCLDASELEVKEALLRSTSDRL